MKIHNASWVNINKYPLILKYINCEMYLYINHKIFKVIPILKEGFNTAHHTTNSCQLATSLY